MFQRTFFLVAPNFHGSTLLARLLNAHPEIVALGDTYPTNDYDTLCGCGKVVSQCNFWVSIKAAVQAEQYGAEPTMLPRFPRLWGWGDAFVYNYAPRSLVRAKLRNQNSAREFTATYETFVNAVHAQHKEANPSVFVDGVKSLARIVALHSAGWPIAGVIHLVRDPMHFVRSTLKQRGDNAGMLLDAAFHWRLYHDRAARLGSFLPYFRLSYHELSANTNSALARLFDFINVGSMPLADLLERRVEPWHFMGNATLQHFDGTIQERVYEVGAVEQCLVRLIAGGGKYE